MEFRLKTKKVYFSGLKNIAVHVTVRLASVWDVLTNKITEGTSVEKIRMLQHTYSDIFDRSALCNFVG